MPYGKMGYASGKKSPSKGKALADRAGGSKWADRFKAKGTAKGGLKRRASKGMKY